VRAGQLKSLFIVAATAFSAAGCAHAPAPDLGLKADPSARENIANPQPPAPIPAQLFIDAANFKIHPVLASAAPLSSLSGKDKKDRKKTLRISFGAPVDGPFGAVDFCKREPQECRLARDTGPVTETPALMELIRKINLDVNHEIEAGKDLDLYGQEEYWTLPQNGKGDCEDYALLKRKRLIAQGVPAASLIMAFVVAKNGEGHAVLVFRTGKNDYVLNNLTDALLPWTETDFRGWVKIETPGNPYVWRGINKTQSRDSMLSDDIRPPSR
jgi:predicted transglutaminase-like cysteine proteinase